jgi:predicted 2-oxoglutarate/Fe(II)-dependent dioxygenase YbiX
MKLEDAIIVLNNLTNKDFIELIKKYINKKSIKKLETFSGLNEDYEGGDLVFYNQDNTEMKRVKCKTTTCIMFPSNFQYPHRIEPITKGTRYSIVAWLI